jgi:hypothetical protein
MLNCTAILGVSDVPDPSVPVDGATSDGTIGSADALPAEAAIGDARQDAADGGAPGPCHSCDFLVPTILEDGACPGSAALYRALYSCICFASPGITDSGIGRCDSRDGGGVCSGFCAYVYSEPPNCETCELAQCAAEVQACQEDDGGGNTSPGDAG